MSTGYRIHIHRKIDNKELGIISANHLKTIFDSEFSNKLGCDGRIDANNLKFDYSKLEDISISAYDKLNSYYDQITEKKLMIMGAANAEIKRELEEDIRYLKDDYIDEVMYVIQSTMFLMGAIGCVVEDQCMYNGKKYDDGTPDVDHAYKYNGSDLPKVKKSYGNGQEYEDSQYIWLKDVYCVVEAC